jgi:diphosphomevalonate decarboxylase
MDPSIFTGQRLPSSLSGKVGWSCPSNIALTKYWGKYGHQLPQNPSISFTLSEARTFTSVRFRPSEDRNAINVDFTFEGNPNKAFAERIKLFLERNEDALPYVRQYDWFIESRNTFPHSSGIASSASAMSCLVMCLVDIERKFLEHMIDETAFLRRVSYLSRLASGSACRSVYPECALWGEVSEIKGSSNLYAIPGSNWLDGIFDNYHDDILIISGQEKSVSSSAGHQLMEGNPYSGIRFSQAYQNTIELKQVLETGDLERFIEIVEGEALTLHALMMTSQPSYVLIKPGTLQVIEAIREFRSNEKIPICFTLDAGPNVHVLYPDKWANECQDFIQDVLIQYCEDGRVIHDHMGIGPIEMSS